jgi:endonuclease III
VTKKELYDFTINYFENAIPVAETELEFRTPYELLIAVILSAQCTDKRVNMTTPALFAAYPTPYELAKADYEEVFPYIKSISYPGNKTKHIIGTAKMLVENYNGEIPEDWNELVKLPGVGRKTANVVASVVFDMPTMPVDTHVFRVSQRIGLVKPSKTPLEVEKQLLQNVPLNLMGKFHHWLILHGRYTCLARSPKCNECGLTSVCKYFKKEKTGVRRQKTE